MQYQHSITPARTLFDLKLKEIWRYRDLLVLFVRRDFGRVPAGAGDI
jgi:lipopolysaccharide transport system permease protein